MKQTQLRRPRRLALRHAIDELVRKWRELPAIDTAATEAFRATRHTLIAATRELLGQEDLLGSEEAELLEWASNAPDYLHTLAMRKVAKALDISEERAGRSSECPQGES